MSKTASVASGLVDNLGSQTLWRAHEFLQVYMILLLRQLCYYNLNSHMQLKGTDLGHGMKTPGEGVGRGGDQASGHFPGMPSEL